MLLKTLVNIGENVEQAMSHVLYFHSADDRFDASFHTNILVNSSGYCQYLPPGNAQTGTLLQ